MIYGETLQSKTGQDIPLFVSGRPVHSKYNPLGEKLSITQDFTGCLLVAGLGGGFHIASILENKNILKFIIIEADKESLDFSCRFENSKKVLNDSRSIACTIDELDEVLRREYVPSLHKNLTLAYLRSWQNENPELAKKIEVQLSESIKKISADFSVQAHFGKLWHRNILTNLKFISKTGHVNDIFPDLKGKTKAAIIAAGPTLDMNITRLKEDKDAYIVATDTACGTLLSYGITPDAVVSVDAQHVSMEHFYCIQKENIHFVFDLASNPEAVEHVHQKGNSISFIRSAHPLSALVSNELNIPYAETGSGTVTIAAADWARQNGFNTLEFYGADFAYSEGKPYCRGTYLEKKYSSTSGRMTTVENMYTSLMFRTELKKVTKGLLGTLGKAPVTNSVLESYGTTLLEWASSKGYVQQDNIFVCNSACQRKKDSKTTKTFDYKIFFDGYISCLKEFEKTTASMSPLEIAGKITDDPMLISLLPLCAAFRSETLAQDISLALHFLLYYNL